MPKQAPPRWTVGKDSAIKMDRSIGAELRQAAQEVIPDALGVMERTVSGFRAVVADRWPVSPYATDSEGNIKNYRQSRNKTPSAELWTAYGSITSEGLDGLIANPAKYIYAVKSSQKGLSKERSAFQQIVKDPAREVGVKLAADIGQSIVKTITSDS